MALWFLFALFLHTTATHTGGPKLDNFVEDVAPGGQLDIVFVGDRSWGIGDKIFYSHVRKLIGAILQQYIAVHPDYARVAVITFGGDSCVVFDYISADNFTMTKCDLFNGDGDMPWNSVDYKYDEQSEVGTNLIAAFEQAAAIFRVGRQNRPPVRQILLVVTDADYNDNEDPIDEATILKSEGVTIYTCGLGNWLKPGQVRILGSYEEYYGSYTDWSILLMYHLTSYSSGQTLHISTIQNVECHFRKFTISFSYFIRQFVVRHLAIQAIRGFHNYNYDLW